MEMLPVVLLAVGHDCLRLTELVEHQHQLAPFDLLDLSREELANLVCELVPDAGPLAFPHPLDYALLGRLHCQPAELLEGDFFLQHVADLEVLVNESSFLHRDLVARILHLCDHLPQADDLD